MEDEGQLVHCGDRRNGASYSSRADEPREEGLKKNWFDLTDRTTEAYCELSVSRHSSSSFRVRATRAPE
jgi:hypothetical protein